MRRLVFAVTGLLLSGMLALLFALRSESFVLQAAHWAVATFSDLRLEMHNPRADLFGGTFSADEIHLIPQGADGPALLSILEFSASLAPAPQHPDQQKGATLNAGSVLIYVSENDNTADPQPMQWLGYLGWLPQRLRIGQLHLITESANTWIFPLKQLRGDRSGDNLYRLTAAADYNGEPLGATVELLAVDKGWFVTAAETSIQLSAPESRSDISLSGTLEGTANSFHYNFALKAFYREISEFLKGFEGGANLAGTLHLQGTMTGNLNGFTLSDATFVLDNMPEYGFEAGGNLTYARSGETSIDLVATGELASLSYLVNWVDLDVGDFGRAQSNVRLSGSLDKPVIDEFRLITGNEAGLTVTMSGQLNLYEETDKDSQGTNAIFLDVQGPSLAVLDHWTGELPYETGHWRASARLTGTPEKLALQNIVFETGLPGAMEIRGSGSVGHISPGNTPQAPYTVSDIQLSLDAHTPNSALLGPVLGRGDIPADHEVSATLALSGTSEILELRDGAVNISTNDLVLTISPISATVRPSERVPVSELASPVLIKLSNSSVLSRYTQQPIPALGPLQINGRLAQKGDKFQLVDIVGTIRQDELDIKTRGKIGNLIELDDISLTTNIKALEVRKILAAVIPAFQTPTSLGTVNGSFKFAGKPDAWMISKLALAAGDEKTAFEFTANGDLNNRAGVASADLSAEFSFRDQQLLQELSGLALMPLSGNLDFTTSAHSASSHLKARVGDTLIHGEGLVELAKEGIKSVRVTLDTPHLYLQDFGFDSAPRSADNVDSSAPPESGNLLASLRENAPLFPVDMTVKIGGITGENSKIDSLLLQLSGVDNRYALAEFSAKYNKALAEIRGVIDLNPDLPVMSLAGQANALPLGALLKDVGVDSSASGSLTILGGITVMGDSPDLLLSNLNGSVAFALENAAIEGAAYDLLATDLLAWIYSGALTEKSTLLECTMAKFILQEGVATTEALYVESSHMVATGTAKFDLVKKNMDVRITPLSKSRLLQVPSEVRIKGSFSNPKPEISPINAVADATSAAIMLVPSLTLKLFGISPSSKKSHRPCEANLGN